MAPPLLPGEELARMKLQIIEAMGDSKNLSLQAARFRKQQVQLETEIQSDKKTVRNLLNSNCDTSKLAQSLETNLKRLEDPLSFTKNGIYQAHDERDAVEHHIVQMCKDYRKLQCYILCYYVRKLLPQELNASGIMNPTEPLAVLPNFMPSMDTMGVLSMEIVEAWYLSATFVLESHVYLDTFLSNDWWDLDLPPKPIISKLEINICRRDLDPYPKNPVSTSQGFYVSPDDQAAILRTNMRALWSLKKNASIIMNLDFQPRTSLGLSDFYHSRLHPFLYALSDIIAEVHYKQCTGKNEIRILLKNHPKPAELHQFMKYNRLERTTGGFYVCEKSVHNVLGEPNDR